MSSRMKSVVCLVGESKKQPEKKKRRSGKQETTERKLSRKKYHKVSGKVGEFDERGREKRC